MENSHKSRLPIWAVILDVLGTLILALGVFSLFAGDEQPLPGFLDIRALSIVLIVAGVLLMMPLVITVIKRAALSSK